jgi:BirA family transcriptional regulator, biotin operon repressor / biotin---[acetyl-CoA-carboxylase] ligase
LGLDLLNHLKGGVWVSGEEIASYLGVSRAAIWKQIQILRTKGYKIESSTNKGYLLAEGQDLLDPKLIQRGLNTKFVGTDLRYFRDVKSTNETARMIASNCKDGTVVLAEVQTEGKGRLSRSWHSPPGGIWMSIVQKPMIPLASAYWINMAASVAVARSLFRLYGLKAGIKWPNDLLIGEQKICGILMEVSAETDRLEHAVVGIGLNANLDVDDFPKDWNATSLCEILGYMVSRNDLIRTLLQEIDLTYAQIGSSKILSEWRNRSTTLGRQVRITSAEENIEGEAVFLSDDGALFVKLPSEIRRIVAGDCIHLRAM